jgi:hypothetical protein
LVSDNLINFSRFLSVELILETEKTAILIRLTHQCLDRQ